LSGEIRVHQAVVARLCKLEAARRLRKRVEDAERLDPIDDIRREVEQAAYTLMLLADREEHRVGNAAAAAETYRRVIAHFPRTHWAQVARNRLSNLTKRTGETL
ncbi:MAG TPA: hypothetical protein VMZ50_08090, partial [Phycisphaerae bacterium]|nr:hypothetical protein [Phycisphaerae bacterium]